MNIQQLRILREAARCNYNLTEVANVLYTSQSGVSRHIKELEDELNIELFVRQGKRLLDMTEPGKAILTIAERILNDISHIRRIPSVFINNEEGSLVIATTDVQSRYRLPSTIHAFRTLFPKVHISIHHGTASEISEMLQSGEADIAISSESLVISDIARFPYYRWSYDVIVQNGHPYANLDNITLDKLGTVPLITYHQGHFPRSNIDKAFNTIKLNPNIMLNVQESDVIKTYVELGLGVGIITDKCFDEVRDSALLTRIDAAHLFGYNMTWLGLKKYQLQKNYVLKFVQLCNPELTFDIIKEHIFSEQTVLGIDYQI